MKRSEPRLAASKQGPRPEQCLHNAINASCKTRLFRICFVTKHTENQVPNARRDFAKLTITCQKWSQIALSTFFFASRSILQRFASGVSAFSFSKGGRILWELNLGDDKLRLRRLSARLVLRIQRHVAQEKQLAQSVCFYRPC